MAVPRHKPGTLDFSLGDPTIDMAGSLMPMFTMADSETAQVVAYVWIDPAYMDLFVQPIEHVSPGCESLANDQNLPDSPLRMWANRSVPTA